MYLKEKEKLEVPYLLTILALMIIFMYTPMVMVQALGNSLFIVHHGVNGTSQQLFWLISGNSAILKKWIN